MFTNGLFGHTLIEMGEQTAVEQEKGRGAAVHIGTCSWTDKTLIESGEFYPDLWMSAEERLRFYAANFDTVEVDSTFYALPSEKVVGLQVDRTPAGFTLHYKAFGLLTQHSVDPKRLPRAVKELLPPEALELSRLYPQDVPEEAAHRVWRMFASALSPAKNAGKLGVVLFQFPPYFTYSEPNKEYILFCRDRLRDYRLAVEFRHNSWTEADRLEEVLEWLRDHDLIYTAVDEPQFPRGKTVPPLAVTTADISYIRLHGRNRENWYKKNITVAERFAYEYNDEELGHWANKIELISPFTSEIYVMFNNCFRNFAVKNAGRMVSLLERPPGPK